MDPLTTKELLGFGFSAASLGLTAFYFYSNRRHAESKEQRLAREATEKAEKAARAADDKRRDDDIAHLKGCHEATTRQIELLTKVHTESAMRQESQLAAFLQYAKDQSAHHVEVIKLVERDSAREKSLSSIENSVKELSKMVTDYIIHRGNG